MRIAFAGTPEVAVDSLAALLASDHEVALVITRLDAPAGRGKVLTQSPVAKFAQEHNLPLLKTDDVAAVSVAEFDAVVVVAFGAMIPAAQLAVPKHGWLNLHFSLLPQWRGAAPVQRSLISGDKLSGITVFRIDEGLDTGPILGQMSCQIEPEEDAGALFVRLSKLGNAVLVSVLDRLQSGQIQAVDQTTQGISYAAKLRSTDAHIDWSDSAAQIHNLIRGCTPAPGAWTQYRDLRIKISRSRLANHVTDLGPGAVAIRDGLFMVGTGTHALHLETLQPAGKTQMPATSWLNGQHEQVQFT